MRNAGPVRVVDDHGRFAGMLIVLEVRVAFYLVRWLGQRERWEIEHAKLDRMVEGPRVRA